jgi:hypothetical protein
VRQFQQYDIAASNFKQKFKQLPGDSTLFPSTGIAGDNDKDIEGADYWGGHISGGGLGTNPAESANFWSHMSLSGMIKESYTVHTPSNSIIPGTNAPKAKTGKNDPIIVGTSLNTLGYGVVVEFGEYWSLCPVATTYNAKFCRGGYDYALKPITALAIDKKMDDGLPWQGKVLAINDIGQYPIFPGYSHGGDIYGCVEANPATTPLTTYRVALDYHLCNLLVKMFSIAGQ